MPPDAPHRTRVDADLFFLNLGGIRLSRADVDEMSPEEREGHCAALLDHLKRRLEAMKKK